MAGFFGMKQPDPLPAVVERDPADLDPVTYANRRRAMRAAREQQGVESLFNTLNTGGTSSQTNVGTRVSAPT